MPSQLSKRSPSLMRFAIVTWPVTTLFDSCVQVQVGSSQHRSGQGLPGQSLSQRQMRDKTFNRKVAPRSMGRIQVLGRNAAWYVFQLCLLCRSHAAWCMFLPRLLCRGRDESKIVTTHPSVRKRRFDFYLWPPSVATSHPHVLKDWTVKDFLQCFCI